MSLTFYFFLYLFSTTITITTTTITTTTSPPLLLLTLYYTSFHLYLPYFIIIILIISNNNNNNNQLVIPSNVGQLIVHTYDLLSLFYNSISNRTILIYISFRSFPHHHKVRGRIPILWPADRTGYLLK